MESRSTKNPYIITPATAFVDWNSQIHAANPPRGGNEIQVAEKTLAYVGKTISKALSKIDEISRFDVSLRLYHGWHRGFEVTARRKALISVAAAAEFGSISDRPNVLIRPDISFGDSIISANMARIHVRIGCHLPNTLRASLRIPGESEEKMVDTAIAADIVDMAHRESNRWLIIVGEDDDLIPPLFAADGIRGELSTPSGRVLLVRSRLNTPFLKLDGLRVAP